MLSLEHEVNENSAKDRQKEDAHPKKYGYNTITKADIVYFDCYQELVKSKVICFFCLPEKGVFPLGNEITAELKLGP